jgi:hypothetical protein
MSGTSGKTPWGRERVEEAWAEIDEILRPSTRQRDAIDEALATPTQSPWGRALDPKGPTVRDFKEVGLSEADARAASAGLTEGKFLSFEDACLSTAIFGPSKSVQLNEDAMRRKARYFASVQS